MDLNNRLSLDIQKLDKKFRKSCEQILLLNNKIDDLQTRYDLALHNNRRSFRYSIRLHLATLEGVRNMFYEFASRCADQLEVLQNQLESPLRPHTSRNLSTSSQAARSQFIPNIQTMDTFLFQVKSTNSWRYCDSVFDQMFTIMQ